MKGLGRNSVVECKGPVLHPQLRKEEKEWVIILRIYLLGCDVN